MDGRVRRKYPKWMEGGGGRKKRFQLSRFVFGEEERTDLIPTENWLFWGAGGLSKGEETGSVCTEIKN